MVAAEPQDPPPPSRPGTEEIFGVDAYVRAFDAAVVDVDADGGRVRLDRTAFYPTSGGQPHDVGTLTWDGRTARVTKVRREDGEIWHWLDGDDRPGPGQAVHGDLDWDRRHLLMRTHTALHILCGVMWVDHGVAVTGGNMEPGTGRLDFELDRMSVDLGRQIEGRINEEIRRGREIRVERVSRAAADEDAALIRTRAGLLPRHIDPLRVIDIVGLDRQADGGTHVASTAEVGRVEVTRAESKGRVNKRIRLAVHDA